MVSGVVLLVGAAIALRWVYDLLRPLLWVFVVVSLLVLAGMAWARFGARRF